MESDNESAREFSPEIGDQTPPSLVCRVSQRRRLFSDENTTESHVQILEELKKTTTSIGTIANRIDAIENQLNSVEKQQTEFLSPASSSREAKKAKVSSRVRGEVRSLYKTLLEDDSFLGFNTKKRFTDKDNQDVLLKLRDEMRTLNPDITPVEIRDASQRFYRSLVDKESLKSKGKYSQKVKKTRQRNRINRKLELRKSTLLKSNVPEDQKKMALEPLVKEFMSSESSDEEDLNDGTGNTRPVIVIKPLQWRGAKANRLMQRLDNRARSNMSKQSLQQTLPRVIGPASTRPKPVSFADNFWGFIAP